jgi:hypothetical protein
MIFSKTYRDRAAAEMTSSKTYRNRTAAMDISGLGHRKERKKVFSLCVCFSFILSLLSFC